MKTQYFYTKHYPFQWSGGPMIILYNDDGELIASLEEANVAAIALRNKLYTHNDADRT